jgi:hypothetical protein
MKITPKNWTSFQHYKNRRPPWIKLYRGLIDDMHFQRLPVASRALAPCLWLLASDYQDGVIEMSVEEIAFRLRFDVKEINQGLKPLIDNGFFIVLDECNHDASNVLASRLQHAIPERETERETEKEREVIKTQKASRLNLDSLPEDWKQFCEKERPELNPVKVFDSFKDYWVGVSGTKGVKNDWLATWRNWVRRETASPANKKHEKPDFMKGLANART